MDTKKEITFIGFARQPYTFPTHLVTLDATSALGVAAGALVVTRAIRGMLIGVEALRRD
ncbi:MAG TPA: hypothetical protein VH539_17505 [Gemmatimonadaceae bacterium]